MIDTRSLWQRFWILTVAAVAVSGCGQHKSVKTFPVKGTVTYRGQPVVGATVTYLNSVDETYRPAGTTDAEGKFSLFTYVGPKEVLAGAPPGDYQVSVVKRSSAAASAPAPTADYNTLSDQQRTELMNKAWQSQQEKEQAMPPGPSSELPDKYALPGTSGLKATVVAGENKPQVFELSDD